MSVNRRIVVYDTTLRDGAQGPAVSFSASDKVRIARALDELGFDYVEGGFPGSNPKDEELFASLEKHPLERARLAAFGATRRANGRCEDDASLDPGRQERFLAGEHRAANHQQREPGHGGGVGGLRPGPRSRADLRCRALLRRLRARLGVCDRGMPHGRSSGRGVGAVCRALEAAGLPTRVGIHTHNDCELAVANTLEGVIAGADMVQGTINGYGERCGNANLVSVVANLVLKLGFDALPDTSVARFSDLSRMVAEIANLALPLQQPFVGHGAFAHKGGQHVAAVLKHKDSYQHIDPSLVGNEGRVLVSELSGRGNVLAKAREFGLELDRDDPQTKWLVQHLKELEHRGYSYEAADASFEMLVRRLQPGYQAPWTVADFTTQVRKNGGSVHAEATVQVEVGGTLYHTAASGNGPVNALDAALRKALSPQFPGLSGVTLHDYKVRILDGNAGTAATTRVLIESGQGLKRWTTVGCSSNIIEASLLALIDSLEYAQQV